MNKTIILVLATAMTIAQLPAASPLPVSIVEGADHCAACGMAVHDDGYAAELVLDDGTVLKFDGIAEALVHAKDKQLAVKAPFVQSVGTKEWLDTAAAWYAFTKSVKTPMNVGIHAFRTNAERKAFLDANQDAKPVAYAELGSYFKPMGKMQTGNAKK